MNIILERLKEEKEMRLKGCLYHYTQIKFAYNTNRIEGSKLTEDETRYIYETYTISTGNNKTANVNDIIETVNHFSCFNYLLEIAEEPLSEEIIKNFHNILKRGSSDSFKNWFKIGDYKTRKNIVGDIDTALPSEVNKKMKSLLSNYIKRNIDLDKIIDFHYNFEKIHPFQDGNGRVGRLIMFKECLKNYIVPFIIEDEKKQFYYMGLKEYPNSKTRLIETCLYSQDIYKDALKYFNIDYDNKIINNDTNKEVKNKYKLLKNIKPPNKRQDNLKHIKYHAVTYELKDLIGNITKITELEKYNSKITKLTYKNKNATDVYVLQRKNSSIMDIWHFNNDFNKIQALKFIKDWDERKIGRRDNTRTKKGKKPN